MITELPKPGGDDDGGKTEITPDKGITLYGLVSDKEGTPLEGVVVSDGYSVVASDKKGVYQIVRDPNTKARIHLRAFGVRDPGTGELRLLPGCLPGGQLRHRQQFETLPGRLHA